jgi:hypothetical protein
VPAPIRALHRVERLRRRNARGPGRSSHTLRQRFGVFGRQRRRLDQGDLCSVAIQRPEFGAFRIEIPQAADPDQPLVRRQLRQQLLPAVALQLPIPFQRTRLAERQAQAGDATQQAGCIPQDLAKQRIAERA